MQKSSTSILDGLVCRRRWKSSQVSVPRMRVHSSCDHFHISSMCKSSACTCLGPQPVVCTSFGRTWHALEQRYSVDRVFEHDYAPPPPTCSPRKDFFQSAFHLNSSGRLFSTLPAQLAVFRLAPGSFLIITSKCCSLFFNFFFNCFKYVSDICVKNGHLWLHRWEKKYIFKTFQTAVTDFAATHKKKKKSDMQNITSLAT